MIRNSEESKGATGRFDAFISYSHRQQELAKRISRRIQAYRPPKTLKLKKKKLRVFRDVERLTVSSDVHKALTEQISFSDHIIVLCSPEAAASSYVDDEIAAFIAREGTDAPLVALCEGEPEESLPESLTKGGKEPLYVDLRDLRPGPSGWRKFRQETLRLIAALFDVDYEALNQADLNRRRRNRSAGVLGAVAATIGMVCFWIVTSVAPENWVSIDLPQRHWESPVTPIKVYAVNYKDPSIFLFPVTDANYAANKPSREMKIIQSLSSDFVGAPIEHWKAKLLTRAGPVLQQNPLATIRFKAKNYDEEPIGSGEIHIFGFVDHPAGTLKLLSTLRYVKQSPNGEVKVFTFPPTGPFDTDNPYSFEPWPAEVLFGENLLPWEEAKLSATIREHTTGTNTSVVYEVIDAANLLLDADDGRWFRTAVISNKGEDLNLQLGGETERLGDIEAEDDLWSDIIQSPDWVAYQAPTRRRFTDFANVGTFDDTSATLGEPNVTEENLPQLQAALGGDKQLAEKLLLTTDWPFASNEVIVVERSSGSRSAAIATVINTEYGDAEPVSEIETRHLLRRSGNESWEFTDVPFRSRRGEVLDILPLDKIGDHLLVIVNEDGILETRDGGASWRDFNFGDLRFRSGDKVRLVAAGEAPEIFALLDITPEKVFQNDNILLRYHRRSWIERLRIGLRERLALSSDGI